MPALNLLISLSAFANQSPAPLVFVTACKNEKGAFCYEDVDLLTSRVEASVADEEEIAVSIPQFPNQTTYVRYSHACLSRRANTAELRGFSSWHLRAGRPYTKIVMRLRTDGTCDFTIMAPVATPDEGQVGLSLVLAHIRTCERRGCEKRLGTTLPKAIRALLFKPPPFKVIGALPRDSSALGNKG